jgi:hypothetical protein
MSLFVVFPSIILFVLLSGFAMLLICSYSFFFEIYVFINKIYFSVSYPYCLILIWAFVLLYGLKYKGRKFGPLNLFSPPLPYRS